MRRFVYGLRDGSFNFRTKLSRIEAESMSTLLESYNKFKPIEIHRNIRGLKLVRFWKGSEFRVFLLYLGIVALKDFVTEEIYHHYLLLCCAVTILSSNVYMVYLNIAEKLLEEYIEKFIELYGIDSISSNIHNLCHVVDDVRKHGPLPNISAYPFESFLGYMKILVRSGNKPLSQIAKRILELERLNMTSSKSIETVKLENKIQDIHDVPACKGVYSKIKLAKDFILTNGTKNNFFLTSKRQIVSMINATSLEGKIHIYGKEISNKYDFFKKPFSSSRLNIYATKCEDHTHQCTFNEPKLYSLTEIKCKLFCLNYQSEFVFIPLIHTFDSKITA